VRLGSALGFALVVVASPARADVLPAPAPPLAVEGDDPTPAFANAGRQSTVFVSVDTAPGTRIEWKAVRLPRGAKLVPEEYPSPRARIEWAPSEDQLDDTDAIVEATDGRSRVQKRVRFEVHDSWYGGLMPSAGASFYAPRTGPSGGFLGVPLQIALLGWIRRNDDAGPSHGRIYFHFEILRDTQGSSRTGTDIGFGFDASFERMPRRRWLIPGYGVRLSSFRHADAPDGGFWHVTPELALYLWAQHDLFVHAAFGWQVPFSSFESMHGPRASLGLTMSF
jgi:hypothetical protein